MYIVIPAYEPDIRLIQVVQDITLKLPKARIIVVNDGSGPRESTSPSPAYRDS